MAGLIEFLLARTIRAVAAIEAEACRSEGISAKGFIVMLDARQTV